MAGSLRAGTPCTETVPAPVHLAVPSWRAVSVPDQLHALLSDRLLVLQCPHGEQSPCRVAALSEMGYRVVSCSALMAGSLRAGGIEIKQELFTLVLAVPSWRAVSVPE